MKYSLYRIEVVDKYHSLGLADIKKNWQGSSPDKSYFSIKTPNVEIKNLSEGGTEIVGTPSFLSGRSNVPGDEVNIKRRRIERSSELKENIQNLAQETVICSGAVVSDNGNWQCDRPIIFPVGTYELTAELIKEGKWTCPDNPALTVANKGTFFLYAAQYQKTGSAQLGELGDTYERTSQVTRKYEVTETKINIIAPNHGAKIIKLPFTISGTGEKGSQVYIEGFGGADDCNTTVDTSLGQWSCGPYRPEDGKYTLSADQFIDNQLDSTAQASFEVQTKTVRPVVIT
ncbi:protein of unknown function [Xenorhabdus bovienii]|uniref:Uncharacterized protein n=1 Tax=Xenorhabdus bovienii TaxID=40576 RepID=A0A0B6X9J6_XENBV|nr:protein of unknown function [Xenorhabdus bovienii]